MITTERSRFACDSCNELKYGKIIIASLDSYLPNTETLHLCNDCIENLKSLLEVK